MDSVNGPGADVHELGINQGYVRRIENFVSFRGTPETAGRKPRSAGEYSCAHEMLIEQINKCVSESARGARY
jgi:hypothetical protein